ncbi:MAG: tetratricopeptide repeat protein [Acidobacteriia bacterium]|nr:tetratricopeptide repeat protein [Terriglobia bacterium]
MSLLNRLPSRHRRAAFVFIGVAWLLLASTRILAEEDWQQQVRTAVDQHQIPAALAVVDHRLADAPDDMEARAWRGRLFGWTGRWHEAETEYYLVLDKFPNDEDVLVGLADVLLWQQKYSEALVVLETARNAAPQNSEILVRRARVLSLLQRTAEARAQFQTVLAHDPTNRAAINGLANLKGVPRYELRIGEEADFFNYTDNAQVETVTLAAHWNDKWTTGIGVSPYHLFGENAVKIWAGAAYRFHQNNWVRVLGAGANPQDVVPEREVLVEYGHGFRFSNPWFKGLESSYQEHSLWYRGAQVVALNATDIFYLPKEWTWTLSVTGARTQFPSGESDWVPSGSTKVGFPLYRKLSGNALFAVGAENFAQVDQIGRLSARTYGGGLRYRFAETQDVTGFVARQAREHGQNQTSLGLSYGIRF